MSTRVLAVVVCYNPQIAALKVSLQAVIQQTQGVLLVDNASKNLAEIQQLVADANSEHGTHSDVSKAGFVELNSLSENSGLGAAHNIGFAYARQHGFTHCLLLDQDSVPLAGMVENLLLAAAAKQSDTGAGLSAVGATYLNADNGSESFFVRFGGLKFRRQYCGDRDDDACIEADFLISSGSLFSLRSIDSIGTMDETLFIDHVDTEWFLRARDKGYKAYGVCNAIMQHGLGEQTHRVTIASGRQRNVPQHKPFRYYYIFRNSVLLYKRSYSSKLWIWNDIQRLILIAIMFGVFKSPRWQNSKMMMKGIIDGLRGRSGPLNAGPTVNGPLKSN